MIPPSNALSHILWLSWCIAPINSTKEVLHAQFIDIIGYNGFFLVLLWSTVSMPAEGDFKALIQAHRVTIHNKNLYEVFGNKQLF